MLVPHNYILTLFTDETVNIWERFQSFVVLKACIVSVQKPLVITDWCFQASSTQDAVFYCGERRAAGVSMVNYQSCSFRLSVPEKWPCTNYAPTVCSAGLAA